MMRTSNPTLSVEKFDRVRTYGLNESMTVDGTVNKCFVLFALLLISAAWMWNQVMAISAPGMDYYGQHTAPVVPGRISAFIFGGGIVGFIFALITSFRPQVARFTAPAYALCEGLVLGGISAFFEQTYQGIVIQAVALTFGTLFGMLALYRSGVIKVTSGFIRGVASATFGIMVVYLGSWILGMFGVNVSFLYSSGPIGIGFSLLVVGIAALNLVLDFHIIEQGAQRGANKYMEWYGAFALTVTMVWLYLEILRLLAKMNQRR